MLYVYLLVTAVRSMLLPAAALRLENLATPILGGLPQAAALIWVPAKR